MEMDPDARLESDAPDAHVATSAAEGRAAALSRDAGKAMGSSWWAKMVALMYATASACSCAVKRKGARKSRATPQRLSSPKTIEAAKEAGKTEGEHYRVVPQMLSSAAAIEAAKKAGKTEGTGYRVDPQRLSSAAAIEAAKAAGMTEGKGYRVVPQRLSSAAAIEAAKVAGKTEGKDYKVVSDSQLQKRAAHQAKRMVSDSQLQKRAAHQAKRKLEREAARVAFTSDARTPEARTAKAQAVAAPTIAWLAARYEQDPEGCSYQCVGAARRMEVEMVDVQGHSVMCPRLLSGSELAGWFARPNSSIRVHNGTKAAAKPSASRNGELAKLHADAMLHFHSGASDEAHVDYYGHVVNQAEKIIQQAVVDAGYPMRSKSNVVKVKGAGGCGLAAPGHAPKWLEKQAAGAWFLSAQAFRPNASGVRLIWIDCESYEDDTHAEQVLSRLMSAEPPLPPPDRNEKSTIRPSAAEYAAIVPPSSSWKAIPPSVALRCETANGAKAYLSVVRGTQVFRFWASNGNRVRSWRGMASDYRPFGAERGVAMAWQEHTNTVRRQMATKKKGGCYGDVEFDAQFIKAFAKDDEQAGIMAGDMM